MADFLLVKKCQQTLMHWLPKLNLSVFKGLGKVLSGECPPLEHFFFIMGFIKSHYPFHFHYPFYLFFGETQTFFLLNISSLSQENYKFILYYFFYYFTTFLHHFFTATSKLTPILVIFFIDFLKPFACKLNVGRLIYKIG